jgi:hypothetical protein
MKEHMVALAGPAARMATCAQSTVCPETPSPPTGIRRWLRARRTGDAPATKPMPAKWVAGVPGLFYEPLELQTQHHIKFSM